MIKNAYLESIPDRMNYLEVRLAVLQKLIIGYEDQLEELILEVKEIRHDAIDEVANERMKEIEGR